MARGIFTLSGLGMVLQFADLLIDTAKEDKQKRERIAAARQGSRSRALGGGQPQQFSDVRTLLDVTGRELAKAPLRRTVVPDGKRGSKVLTPERRVAGIVKMIHKYEADPRIRQIAVMTVAKKRGRGWAVDERDWPGEAKAIFGMLRREVRYIRDVTGRDTYVSPLRTLAQLHAGDCDDYAITGGSLLRSIGFNVVVRIIQTKGNKTFNHVYLLVEIPREGSAAEGFGDGTFIPFDPSMPYGFGWQAPKSIVIKKRDFKVPVGDGATSRIYDSGIDSKDEGGRSEDSGDSDEDAEAAGLGDSDAEADDGQNADDDGVYYDA